MELPLKGPEKNYHITSIIIIPVFEIENTQTKLYHVFEFSCGFIYVPTCFFAEKPVRNALTFLPRGAGCELPHGKAAIRRKL